MCLFESETTDGLSDCTAFCGIHIDLGATLNLLQCLCVIVDVKLHSLPDIVETSLALLCSYCHCYVVIVTISSSSLPVLLECTWVLLWLPVWTWKHLHFASWTDKLGTGYPLTSKRICFKFLLAQFCHPLAATTSSLYCSHIHNTEPCKNFSQKF